MLSVITDDAARAELAMSLDELAREGARRMLAVALEAEVDAYIACFAELVDEHGHRLVRRNGHAPARQLATGAGQVEVTRPRVDDRRVDPDTGARRQFQSVILPRWARRSPKVAQVLPLLYLHGLSSGDFVAALEGLLGSAAGLSASVITGSPASGRPNIRPSPSVTWQGSTTCTASRTGSCATRRHTTGRDARARRRAVAADR
jgi:putative transposase